MTPWDDDEGQRVWKDPAHGDRVFKEAHIDALELCDDPNQPKQNRIRAFTTSSDLVDKKARSEARRRGEILTLNSYAIETEYSNTMQICRNTIDNANDGDWPEINRKRITSVMKKGTLNKLRSKGKTPIDAITTLGTTILHEVGLDNSL